MKMQRSLRKNQAGATLVEFIGFIILATFLLLASIKSYSFGTEMKKQGATVTAVVQLKMAADKVMSGNHSSTNMAKVCSSTRNAAPINLCGNSRDGVGVNQYGGNYTLTGNTSNLQQVLIGVTNVDGQYIDDLADMLARVSADNCQSASSCSSLSVSGTTITVTM